MGIRIEKAFSQRGNTDFQQANKKETDHQQNAIKTTKIYHLTPVRMPIIKKKINKC